MAGGRLIRAIGYWFFTILIAWEMALGAYWDLFQIPYVRNVFTHLHLPSYFLVVMGIWKLPCAVVLLMPGVRRMKEWAYAGAFFTYSGAAVLHLSVGDGAGGWAGPVLYALFTVGSWILQPPSRRLVAMDGAVGEKERSRKGGLVAYWIVTGLMAFVLISGGIAELSNSNTAGAPAGAGQGMGVYRDIPGYVGCIHDAYRLSQRGLSSYRYGDLIRPDGPVVGASSSYAKDGGAGVLEGMAPDQHDAIDGCFF